jgi:hypothetical protein
MSARDEAVRMATEAEQAHRDARNLRRFTERRLMEVKLFCAANGVDFEEVRDEAKQRTEATGHGPREARAS